jgi:hypothetical protein
MLPFPPGPIVQKGRELRLHLIEVAYGVFVENHHVRAQALETPVLLRLQHLTHQWHIVLVDDADEEDREIARNTVRP